MAQRLFAFPHPPGSVVAPNLLAFDCPRSLLKVGNAFDCMIFQETGDSLWSERLGIPGIYHTARNDH